MDSTKEQIRCSISSYYDLQKLRIGAGNRLVASFYAQLGVTPSTKDEEGKVTKPDELDKESKTFLDKLKKDYSKITDAIVENQGTIKKQIKDFEKNNGLTYIKNESDYRFVRSYMLLLDSEEDMIKIIDGYVKSHPMWEAFFEPIKGCGTLMSAVCLAYLDPYKARHVSSFFRYAGLDTVRDTDEKGNLIYITQDGKFNKVVEKYHYEDSDGITVEVNEKDVDVSDVFDEVRMSYVCTFRGNTIYKKYDFKGDLPMYEYISGELVGESYVGNVFISEHGRRKGDTVIQEYVDKNGEIKTKRGISYNPILKTKLMGVLTGCLMKAKDPTYTAIYYDYKSRLENNPKHAGKSLAQRNMMAQRYMIKQFLRNMWTTWRNLEGLSVDNPYEVEKLGNKPHKYNEYQCEVAKMQHNNR